MGKTSSMAMLAMKYVDGKTEGMLNYLCVCVNSVVDQHSKILGTLFSDLIFFNSFIEVTFFENGIWHRLVRF